MLILGGSALSVGLPVAPFMWFRAFRRPALWRVCEEGRVLILGGSAHSVGLPCAPFRWFRVVSASPVTQCEWGVEGLLVPRPLSACPVLLLSGSAPSVCLPCALFRWFRAVSPPPIALCEWGVEGLWFRV